MGRRDNKVLREETVSLNVAAFITMPAILCTVFGLLVCAFLWTASFYKKQSISGSLQLKNKPIPVHAPLSGTYAKLLVQNGDRVEAGQVLAVIDTDVVLEGGARHSQLKLLEIEKARSRTALQKESLDLKRTFESEKVKISLDSALRELESSRTMIATYKRNTADIRARFEKMRQLYIKKLMTRDQMDLIKSEFLANKSKIISEQRTIAAIEDRIEKLKIDEKSAMEEINDEARALDQKLIEFDSVELQIKSAAGIEMRARVSGEIAGLNLKEGEVASPEEPLLYLFPIENQLVGKLFVPTSVMPFIDGSLDIWLTFEGYPVEKFGVFPGVMDMSTVSELTDQQIMDYRVAAPSFMVDIKFDPETLEGIQKNFPKKDGIAINSTVRLNERQLWQWLTAPLEKWSKRIGLSEEKAPETVPKSAH